MRIKTFERDSLRVISVSEISENPYLKEELEADGRSYLLSEPHRREELARYIVENLHYDEGARKVYFMKSSNTEANENRRRRRSSIITPS